VTKKIFAYALLQPACSVCVSLSAFSFVIITRTCSCVHTRSVHMQTYMPCYVYTGSFIQFQCFEVKPEEECPLDDKPSTGMFAGSDEHLLFTCTAFALLSFYF